MAQHHRVARPSSRQAKRQDAHEAAGQHFEQVLVERGADFDQRPGLLAHLARERRAMILARIGPPTRQIPFAALVQQQQDTVLIDQHTFDGGRCIGCGG